MDFPVKYKQLWSDWGIRVLMLLSLSIQIILIFLGRWRKTSTSKWIQMLVWSSYLLADWVADFVLGQLSNAMDDSSSSNAIIALWAPFLILHLGGPDTITAYSMEDNALWPRHLVGLIYELIIAFYVLVRSMPNTRLLAPTILIFFVAIIKYAERTYSLYKASTEGFRSSITSSARKKSISISFTTSDVDDLNVLNGSFGIYLVSKPSFIDSYPYSIIYDVYRNDFMESLGNNTLKVMGVILSYAYDDLYTKAAVNHSRVGYILRALCSICIMMAFSLFVLAPKDDYDKLDVAVTYVLLVASIFLDAMATIMLLFSDWMMVTLLNVKKLRKFSKLLAKHIFRIKRVCLKRKYWLREMPQLNLINNCLKNSTLNKGPRRSMMDWIKEKLSSVLGTKSYLSGYLDYKGFTFYTSQPIQATEELQDILTTYAHRRIPICLNESSKPIFLEDIQEVTTALNWVDPSFFEHISELPFDQQVLVWHISTELCFHWKSEHLHPLYPHQITIEAEDKKLRCSKMEVCKCLSNYMMYMVLRRPEMMSTMGGKSPLIFRLTCEAMVQFICRLVDNNRLSLPNAKVEEVCREMLTTPIGSIQAQSLFDLAVVLAHLMLLIKDEVRWHVFTTVWTDLLIQGAKNTKAITHVKQLSRGGELLTFIWLLTKHAMTAKFLYFTRSKIDNLIDMAKELLSKIKDQLQSQH
ncbi:uncharacterized protein LOC110099645 [Dendrobium catenatum]|uniref:DUF4220 domain-containing protein n=1 Tax=Dendrobium catenatum TaxID=906689 RepID=A0A2I0XIL8_9ASPA|nr:uncharacterized protein LOC110099645 [Dendrobium catenatum]PKU87755.1 hypothetical protein MA16_Dca023598 [Dendrobium catenatum]